MSHRLIAALPRYTYLAQLLHWATALVMFALLPIAWVMTALPDKSPRADVLYPLHESLGITVFALVAVRLVWRALHPPPALSEPRIVEWASKASHWLLYLVMVGMPISGWAMATAGGYQPTWFGLPLPGLAKNVALAKLAGQAHATGQWAVYALVTLHLAATAWHLWARRDAVLDRMLPHQSKAHPAPTADSPRS